MLLADIKLIEVSALDIIFKHKSSEPGQGKLSVEYGDVEFEVGATLVENPSNSTIRVKACPAVYGHKEGAATDDFELKISISMLYVYPAEVDIEESYLRENHWYFASMLKCYFKFYADDIFNKSSLNGIKLAYN